MPFGPSAQNQEEYHSVFNTSAANTTRLVPQRDGLRSEAAEEGEQRRQRRPKPEEAEGGPPAILLPQPTDEALGDEVRVRVRVRVRVGVRVRVRVMGRVGVRHDLHGKGREAW